MNGWTDVLFVVTVAWMTVHELDAIARHEWRFFFAWTSLSDTAAYRLFAAAHVPLMMFILWNLPIREFQIGFDLFCIGHAGLHWLLRHLPTLEFNDWFAWVWIWGAAVFGLAHLIVLML